MIGPPVEKEADVVVVGGGINGCAIAYNLAKRGTKVVLLEKGNIADEASGRTFGAVRNLRRFPAEMCWMSESLKLWDQLDEELQARTGFTRGGAIILAENDNDVEAIEASAQLAKDYGLKSYSLKTPKELREIVPGLEGPIKGGLYTPDDGYADPPDTVNAFARAAQENGAQIYTQTPVQGIEVSGGNVSSVITGRGEIKTSTLVCATGIWSAKLARMVGLSLPIKTTRIVGIETEPCSPQFTPFVFGPLGGFRPTSRGTIYLTIGYRLPINYDMATDALRNLRHWMPTLISFRKQIKMNVGVDLLKDIARTLPGSPARKRPFAFSSGVEPKIDRKMLKQIKSKFDQLMPSLKDVKIVRTWGGQMAMTPDMIPILGKVDRPQGLILIVGWSGHGFAPGPIMGHLMTELILDGKTSLSIHPFRYSRFAEGDVQMSQKWI